MGCARCDAWCADNLIGLYKERCSCSCHTSREHTCHDMNPPFPGPCLACAEERGDIAPATNTPYAELRRQRDEAERRLAEHIKLNAVILAALKMALPCVEDHESDANIKKIQRAVAIAEGK